MIIVHSNIPIKPEHSEAAMRLAREMAASTQDEAGCISYEFFVGLEDPNTLVLLQEWETMEALVAHFQTAHMERFLEELPPLLASEVTTRRYAVQTVDEESESFEAEKPPRIVH